MGLAGRQSPAYSLARFTSRRFMPGTFVYPAHTLLRLAPRASLLPTLLESTRQHATRDTFPGEARDLSVCRAATGEATRQR